MSRPISPPNAERGFMLVGVILFVLVLTILGLSLFSLSSFESQFFYRSRDKTRAFQAAMAGIDRARFAIATDGHMENVQANLGPTGVTYAVAWQADRDDSTGSCWNSSDPVTIRVLAGAGQDREMLEASFDPEAGAGLYRRLMTLNGELYVTPADGFGSRIDYTQLQGEIRKRGPDLVGPWGPSNPSVEVWDNIPLPDLTGSWWTTRLASATEVNELGNNNRWDLLAGAGNIGYFYTDVLGGDDPNFSVSGFNSSPATEFTVSGTAVWLLPRGARFFPNVTVTGSGTLVIVARPAMNGSFAGLGLGFLGSISATGVNVILVSSGDVRIEHLETNQSETSRIDYLSIFARDCRITGPYNAAFPFSDRLTLTHVPGDSRDAPGGLIDDLLSANALPNAGAGARGKLSPVAGTWRRVTESNPN